MRGGGASLLLLHFPLSTKSIPLTTLILRFSQAADSAEVEREEEREADLHSVAEGDINRPIVVCPLHRGLPSSTLRMFPHRTSRTPVYQLNRVFLFPLFSFCFS